MPTNTELLHELRRHGAKPPPRRPPPAVGRRTRDFLLCAGIGNAVIVFASFRLLNGSDPAVPLRLALTGVSVYSGLLAFIFFGVMNRY